MNSVKNGGQTSTRNKPTGLPQSSKDFLSPKGHWGFKNTLTSASKPSVGTSVSYKPPMKSRARVSHLGSHT